jgi:hypothetical protein
MERRAFERISTNIYAKFFCDRILHTGIMTNLSKNGMHIKTKAYLPFKSESEVLFPLMEEV